MKVTQGHRTSQDELLLYISWDLIVQYIICDCFCLPLESVSSLSMESLAYYIVLVIHSNRRIYVCIHCIFNVP